jgi:hypothetical protein
MPSPRPLQRRALVGRQRGQRIDRRRIGLRGVATCALRRTGVLGMPVSFAIWRLLLPAALPASIAAWISAFAWRRHGARAGREAVARDDRGQDRQHGGGTPENCVCRSSFAVCRRAHDPGRPQPLPCGGRRRTDEAALDDPLAFVISTNLVRRHLDESQRSIVAAKIANMRQGERTDLPQIRGRLSQTEAAKALNVGLRSVQSAKVVLKDGDAALVRRRAGQDAVGPRGPRHTGTGNSFRIVKMH